MNLQACLPSHLQGTATTITRMAAGLSGAGVFRVHSEAGAHVLKISDENEPIDRWHRKLHVQELAANAGLAPAIVHTDATRRAVVTDFIVDRFFPALFMNPATRDAAMTQLGETLRRVHDLPLAADADFRDPRELLAEIATQLEGFAVPAFVLDAIRWGVSEVPPPPERPEVLSHNDVNPSNLVYDGERLMLLDWEVAGRNDPYYDLAAIAVFFRMDADTCRRLIEIHDGWPLSALSPRFLYVRRFVATLIGAMFMRLTRESGHPGATGTETLESALSLADFFQAMRNGTMNIATGDGKFAFGMSLIKAGLAL